MQYELLIFDLDGTLIDSQYDLATAVNLLRASHNTAPLTLDIIRSYVGNGINNLVEQAVQDAYKSNPTETIRQFRSLYKEHLLDTTVLYNGVQNLLSCTSSHKKAVLTNKSEEFASAILSGLGAANYFSIIAGNSNSMKLKPSPDPIINILNKLNIKNTGALMIGDGRNDILSAKAANIRCAAIGYGYTRREELLELDPDYFFDSVGELSSFICGGKTSQKSTP